MGARSHILNRIVAAILPLFLTCSFAAAQDSAKLDDLFTRLQAAPEDEAGRIEQEIQIEWSKSGSPALDLLLQRGRDALEMGDTEAAIEHLTALVDHDPGFAEGWSARAAAFYQAGDFGPAMADIAQVLVLNPRHFGALSGLGMIFEASEDPERALKAYEAALALHPHLEGARDAVARLSAQTEGQEL
jgi:tetratricopeptide (TPR) repeat protein